MKSIKQKLWAGAAAVMLLWMGPSRVAASFIVTNWALGSSVFDYSTNQGNQAYNGVPQPAFNQSLNSAYSNSVAQVAYAYNYSLATGQFNTNVHLEAQGGPNFRSGTDNLVRFTPSTDVLLTIDAQWQFQMAGGDRESRMSIRVGRVADEPPILHFEKISTLVFGGPAAAVWSYQDSLLLTAGQEYFFRSIFHFWNLSGSPTALSIGNGYANFTLTTVPSPAALGPLAFAALLVRLRRRRC